VRARLVPLSSLFARFVRPVRDLSRERGLAVELRHTGGDHAMDKAICDQLAEPLLHVVRNAVAHGIEPAAERKRLGKPATGSITIAARADGDRTIITVTDDGRGLNVARLRERARSLGIAADDLDDQECLRLALLPRLSTAERVDDLSGRGVGLDAAEQAIKALGGSLNIQSRPGEGACFVLEVPSSLSLLKGLVVRLGGERYVLPVSSVVSTFRVTPDMLHELNGRRVVRWKQLVPWLDLGALLSVPRTGRPEASRVGYAALVHTGTSVRALGVDAVLGSVEAIVKPLDSGIPRLPCVTGAALLGDGGVALILNPRALAERTAQAGSLEAHHA
jgi:two-component system chemotaxis sensor kinase CheA